MSLHLWLDCETGGTEPQYTDLLQAAFIVTNGRNVELGRLELLLKPDNDIFRVTPGALKVNRIDLIEHAAKAVTYHVGAQMLRDFLAKYKATTGHRLKPAGWNPGFDVGYVTSHLIDVREWGSYCGYGLLDVQSIVYFLAGSVLPAEYLGLPMQDVAQKMKVIEWDADRHNAMRDIEATLGIYTSLDEMFKGAANAPSTT